MGSAAAAGHQRIFISYRREEASGHAGRIYDAMVARFGEDNVFMDVDIAPGVDFVDHITNVVSSCTVLIAVMGKSWAEAPGPDGRPRLQDEADFVRLEVGTAVQNPDVTVIPALVDKAQMPKAEQLPEAMRPLARRNALELSDGRWRYDVGRLNETLEQLLEGLTEFPRQVQPEPPTPAPPTPVPTAAALPSEPEPPPRTYSFPEAARLVLEGVLVAAVAAYFGRLLADPIPSWDGDTGHVATIAAQRGLTWGLTGVALALWLAFRARRRDLVRCGLLGLLIGVIAGAVGGAIFGLPVRLPDPNLSDTAKEDWDVVSLAVTGALIGGLIGTLWRRPRLAAGLASGFLAGLLIQALINNRDWNSREMPEIGYVFALRAGVIAGVTLAVLLALDARRAIRAPSTSASPS